MTKKQYEKLKNYEEQLTSAKIGNYVRKMYSTSLEELDTIYKEIFPTLPDSRLKSGCSTCVLKAMKKLADVYFEYKEKQDKKNDKK